MTGLRALAQTPITRPSEPTPTPWNRGDWFAVLGMFLISLTFVGLMGDQYPTLSPIDELQHIDYAIKASKLDFVQKNERIGQEALHEAACRSVDAPGYVSPPCDLSITHDPNLFQERGVNTASSANPPYYVTSGVIGRLIKKLTPIDSIVGAIRLSGAFWMTAAFGMLWLLLAEFGIDRIQRGVTVALMTATPHIVFGFSTVNTDNAILPTCALLFLLTLRYERARFPWWGLAIASIVAIGIELTNSLAVLASGTYLGARSVQARPIDWRKLTLGAAFVGGTVPTFRWLGRLHHWLIEPLPNLDFQLPRNAIFNAEPGYVTMDLLVSRLTALTTPISEPYLPMLLRGTITTTLLQFTSWILIGTVMAAVLTQPTRSRVSLLCGSAVLWLLIAGPLFTLRWSNSTLPIPARYGLPLLPLLLLGTASVLKKKAALLSLGAFAAYGNGYMLYLLLRA